MQKHNPQQLLEGAIGKRLFSLALPVLIAMSFQTVYALANLYFVGRLGGKAVAALSISLNAFFIVLTLGQTLGIGGMSLIAQSWGANKFEQARLYFTQLVWIVLGMGLVSWLCAHFGARTYIGFFTQDPEVFELGVQYFSIYSATFFLQLFLMSVGFCFRGSGDFKTPMYVMLVSVLMNIALDPLLIYGLAGFPKLGVRGAAIASVVSQVTSSLVMTWLILRKKLNLYLVHFRLDLTAIRELLAIGVPSGLQYLILAAVLMLTYRWVRPMGAEVTAAIGVGFRLLHSSYLPMVSFAVATSSMVGQNYGAQLWQRVRGSVRHGLIYTNLWSIFITTLFILFPTTFLSCFTKDPVVLAHGKTYLHIFGLSNLFVASIFIITSTFQGLGKTWMPLLGACLKLAVFTIFYLFVGHNITLEFVYYCALFSVFIELLWDIYQIRQVMKESYGDATVHAAVVSPQR